MNLGSILGGIAGLVIPGGTAMTAALGSGIGTLISGGKPKDAIKNAVLFGAGSKIFPGVGEALQQTQMSRALAGMGVGIGGAAAAAAPAAQAAQAAATAQAAQTAAPAAAGLFNSPNALLYGGLGLSALGALETPEQPGRGGFRLSQNEGYESWMSEDELRKNLYASAIDGSRFDSAEERDTYDKMMRERQRAQMEGSLGNTSPRGFEYGGLIEGPGSVTSDDIPGRIMQDGLPTEEILVSNGEVILSGRDLAQLDPNGNYEKAGRELGDAPNGSRGAKAAEMFARTQEFKKGMNHG